MEAILFICSGSMACGPCLGMIGSNRLPVDIVRLDTRESRTFLSGKSGLTITHVPTLVLVQPDGRASTFVGTQSVLKWLSSMFTSPPEASRIERSYPIERPLPVLGSFGPTSEMIEDTPPKKELTFEMASEVRDPPKSSKSRKSSVGKTKLKRKTKKSREEEDEGKGIALEILGDDGETSPTPEPTGYVDARTAKGRAIAQPTSRSNKDLKAAAAALQQGREQSLKSSYSRWGVRGDDET